MMKYTFSFLLIIVMGNCSYSQVKNNANVLRNAFKPNTLLYYKVRITNFDDNGDSSFFDKTVSMKVLKSIQKQDTLIVFFDHFFYDGLNSKDSDVSSPKIIILTPNECYEPSVPNLKALRSYGDWSKVNIDSLIKNEIFSLLMYHSENSQNETDARYFLTSIQNNYRIKIKNKKIARTTAFVLDKTQSLRSLYIVFSNEIGFIKFNISIGGKTPMSANYLLEKITRP